MLRIKDSVLLVCLCCAALFIACNKSTEPEDKTTTSGADTSTANVSDHEDNDDYTWDAASAIPVVLNGTSITSNASGVTVSGSKATINAAGVYKLSGSLTDGQIIVEAGTDAIVKLVMDGANINCSNNAPVYIKSSKKTIVILVENTSNSLTDGSTYVLENSAVDEPNAALYSKSDLSIAGEGSLTVTGKYNDGIASIDGFIINGGKISVSSLDDGLRGKDYMIIKAGDVSVTAKGNGIKSDNAEDASRGYVSINDGTVTITATGDGVTAQTDAIVNGGTLNITTGGGSSKTVTGTASAKALKGIVSTIINGGVITASAADDAIHSNGYVKINGGTSSVSSGDDGIHADVAIEINGGETNITKSVEGVEGPAITVNGGTLNIVSTDDGFNATKGNGGESNDGSTLTLNGGNISVNSSNGDGLDSNGNIVMTGGTVVTHGPKSNPEVGTDYNGTFNISGGFLVLTGPNSGNMIEATSTSSSQYSVKATSSSSLTTTNLFHVEDESGNDIVTFKPVRNAYYIVFSSPNLKSGATYSIYVGGTTTGTEFHGLYTGGSYSGGTLKKTFTVSGKVTSVSF